MRDLRDIPESKISYQNIGSIDPVTGAAIIGGVAKIGSALLGSSAQKKQLQLQAEEARRQGKIDEEQLALARRMIEIGLATQVDAQGNMTTYDEATNTWKVIPSAVTRQMLNASNDEILRQFNYDAPMARGEALRNSARRAQESGIAEGMQQDVRDSLQGQGQRKAGDIAGMLRLAREQAVNKGFDDVGASVATQALRSGSNGAGAAAQLAKARAQAIAQVMGTPDLEGIQIADDLNANKTANRINNYSAMAGRAAASDGFSAPGSVAPALNASLQAARSGGASSMQGAAQGIQAAGQPNNVAGVFNPAGVIGALGNAGADFFKSWYKEPSDFSPVVSKKESDRALASLRRGESF